MNRISKFPTKYSLWLSAVILFVVHFATAFAGTFDALTQDLISLSADEMSQARALDRLKTRSDVEITTALTPMLDSPTTLRYALRALQSLKLPSFTTKLKDLARTSVVPEVFVALTSHADAKDADVAGVYKSRLNTLVGQKKSSGLKISLLEGLSKFQADIGDTTYAKLLQDDDYLVREAAIRQFLSSRKQLALESQVKRFKAAFHVKPLQARMIANTGYAALDSKDRLALRSAFDGQACARDAHSPGHNDRSVSCESQEK